MDGTPTPSGGVSMYVRHHNIHILLDRMVKDILLDKPEDSDAWMLRWFLEQHRQDCAERHKNSAPNAVEGKPWRDDDDQDGLT